MIKIIPFNETYVKIRCADEGIEYELYDYFSFLSDGYKYTPKYKAGIWDGYIRLFNRKTKTIYKGLVEELIKFAKSRNHEIEVDESLRNINSLQHETVCEFVDKLNLHGKGNPLTIREYQYDAVHVALSRDRTLLVSPTASGKSALIYSITRWHILKENNIMIVVPSTMLAEQLFSDFADYSSANGFSVQDNFSVLYSGKERVFNKPVVITTWQSIVAISKNDPEKFQELVNRINVGIWDEAHTQKSTVVLGVMEQFIKTKTRIGTTGTLDGSKINTLSLVGLMGPVHKVISTKELMDAGQVVPLKIHCLVLEYADHIKKAYNGMDYKQEIDFLVGYEARNNFIAKLAVKTSGNTLILQNFVERHGEVIFELIKQMTDRKVIFINGKVKPAEREEIRKQLDNETDAIIVATSSLMATGVNIPSIENIIFAIPNKSTIRVRQSIGRGLRLREGKTHCNLFDISDDLRYKKFTNTTFNHLHERVKIYEQEQFDYTFRKIPLINKNTTETLE